MNLKEILEKHIKWLSGEHNGEKANLSGADLRYANLRCADLRGADLSGADLSNANTSRIRGMKILNVDNIVTFGFKNNSGENKQ